MAHKIKNGDFWSIAEAPGDSHGWKTIIRIKNRLLSMNNKEDTLKLMTAPSGKYNTTSIYEQWRPTSADVPWAKHIWGAHHLPRHSFITWIALQERLPTLQRLLDWGITDSSTCKLCGTAAETESHLLFECQYSTQVPQHITCKARWGVSATNWKGLIQDLNSAVQRKDKHYKNWCTIFTTMIYHIWKTRNKLINCNQRSSVEECSQETWSAILDKIQSNSRAWVITFAIWFAALFICSAGYFVIGFRPFC